jgi:hypothetical protein
MVKSVAAQGIFTCMSDKIYYSAVLKKKECTPSLQHCSALSSFVQTHFCQCQHVAKCLYISIDSFNFCQTPTSGETWELTLLGNKKNNLAKLGAGRG